MADLPNVCEHINLPVQAGDDEVLKRMRRTYTADLWRDRIAYTRDPELPGRNHRDRHHRRLPARTGAQFQNTLDLLEDIGCDKVHVAMYSPRPGTLSARWEDDMSARGEAPPPSGGRETCRSESLTSRNQERIGEPFEVLVDKPPERAAGPAVPAAIPSSTLPTSALSSEK